MLALFAVLPLLVLLYLRIQRRRSALLEKQSALGLGLNAKRAIGRRRHIPPLLMLFALAMLVLAVARPQSVVSLPRVGGTVLLTFDVSGSMAAKDIEPSRMEAAKAAAIAFVESQPSTVEIGVVAFSEGGLSVQSPTYDRQQIIAAIRRLAPTRGTSLANGILVSLKALETADQKLQGDRIYTNRTPGPTAEPTPVPAGYTAPAVIVLLSDGENNVNPEPLEAAQVARDRGVRVHTVGVGSPEGATLKVDGFNIRTQLDETALRQVAEATGGEYYNARSAEELQQVYDSVGTRLTVRPQETELTALFAGAAIAALLIGAVLSLIWFNRMP